MLDWKSGDQLVAIKTGECRCGSRFCSWSKLDNLVVGRKYTVRFLAEAADDSGCADKCGSDIVVVLEEQEEYWFGYCTCCFRKPIDFSDLLKVTTINLKCEELEDA